MDHGTYKSRTHNMDAPPEATFAAVIKEQMTKRDTELAEAMQSLEAVAQKVTASVARFVDLASPDARMAPLDRTAVLTHDSHSPKAFGLAGEINRVTYRLRLLQAAVDRATRQRRRSTASKTWSSPLSPDAAAGSAGQTDSDFRSTRATSIAG